MKKKAMALVLALVMVLSLLPVTAMAGDSSVTIGNHGYPWMRWEGSSLSQYLNLDITGEATSYLWMSADEKDGTYSAVSSEVSTNSELRCEYASGKWVKCVVNGTVESKPVYIVHKSVGNRSIFNITNGTVGYTLTGSSFDVYGKFGDTWKSTSNGGREDTWSLFAVRGNNPNENATSSVSQLASFRAYFLDHDPYKVMMEATMTEGHFSFGTDLGLGDKAMTNIIRNDDGDVTGIQMIEAKNKILANENSPSIVISTPTPDKWWLGSGMSKIKPFTQGTSDESFGTWEAGITFSWLNLPANTVIPFSASVGAVKDTGADLGDRIPTYTLTFDRTNVAEGYPTLYTYDKDDNELSYIWENNATAVVTTDGYAKIWAQQEFYVTAAGATVGELIDGGSGWYYREITNFTKDTTIVVSDEPAPVPSYTITLDGSDFSGRYLLLNAYDNAGGRVGRIDEDGASISMPQDGFVEVLTSHECIVTAEGATVVALPHAEEAEVYGYKITNFTDDTTVVVSDFPPVDTMDLTVDMNKLPNLVVGEAAPDPIYFDDPVEQYVLIDCVGLKGYAYGWAKEDSSEDFGWIGIDSNDMITADDKYAFVVELGLKDGYTFAEEVTVNVNGGLPTEIAYNAGTGMALVIELGTLEDIEAAKHSHEMTKTAAKAATCTADGNIEYYTCSGCGKTFADEAGKKELTAAELVVKSEGHKMTKTAAKAATCTADGNIEYFTCSVCDKFFADEEGKTELAADKLVVKSTGHDVKEIAANAPTYTANGNKAFFFCDTCDTAFADAEGKTALTESQIKDLVIPQLILVEEDKAEVSEGAVDKALSETKKDEDVTLDLTHKDVVGAENVDAVAKAELPVAALEAVAKEDKALTLVKEDAIVTLDTKALEAVVEQAKGTSVTLVVKGVEKTTLKPVQQAAVENKKVAVTISAELICDQTGEKIATKAGKGFGGGGVTVAVPVPAKLPEGIKASDLKVYFVDTDGTVEHLSSKLEDGKIVFTLKHFSEYVIAADAPATSPATGDNTNMTMYFMLAAISAAAVVLLIVSEKKNKARYF